MQRGDKVEYVGPHPIAFDGTPHLLTGRRGTVAHLHPDGRRILVQYKKPWLLIYVWKKDLKLL